MSYIRSRTAKAYIGFSTDEKPFRGRQADGTTITHTDLPQGSTFAELDTGKTKVFMGPENEKGEWVYLPTPPGNDVIGKLDELLAVLIEMREMQKAMLLAMAGG